MRLTSLTLLATAFAFAACADPTAPGAGRPALEATAPEPLDDARFARQGPTATPLETLQLSRWVVSGRRQTIEIDYTDPDGLAETDPTIVLEYLRLDFADKTLSRRPDGSAFQAGDSVLVTITVDPVRFQIALEPSGLVFDAKDALKLRVRYQRADPDFDGNGVVDAADETVRTTWLGLWLQDGPTGLWSRIPAQHSLDSRKFDATLEHFSNYAVAW